MLCHPTCISSPWGYVQLVYTYLEIYVNPGKYTTIKVNVILVALIFPFSTLHIVTFSDVDYWDHNRGTFVTQVSSCPPPRYFGQISPGAPHPSTVHSLPVLLILLHITLLRKPLFIGTLFFFDICTWIIFINRLITLHIYRLNGLQQRQYHKS